MINLYSDTQTKPSEGMRRAMYEAEVADEQRGLDPTVNALQDRVAELLGKEAGLFLPSGTMCNAISFRLHITAHGDEDTRERALQAGAVAFLKKPFQSAALVDAVRTALSAT